MLYQLAFLSIGRQFYLQYFKSGKTTYVTQFLSMSYDYGLLTHYSLHEED